MRKGNEEIGPDQGGVSTGCRSGPGPFSRIVVQARLLLFASAAQGFARPSEQNRSQSVNFWARSPEVEKIGRIRLLTPRLPLTRKLASPDAPSAILPERTEEESGA